MEEIIQAEQKNYKTPEAKRIKAFNRYKEKKADILKMISLKTIMASGKIPSQTQILKHNLSWEDISRGLQEYNKDKDKDREVPVEVQIAEDRIRLLEWKHELDLFKKLVNRGPGSLDDFTRMYRRYIETYSCEHCNKNFSKENPRTWNVCETTGFFNLILCRECLPQEKKSSGEA